MRLMAHVCVGAVAVGLAGPAVPARTAGDRNGQPHCPTSGQGHAAAAELLRPGEASPRPAGATSSSRPFGAPTASGSTASSWTSRPSGSTVSIDANKRDSASDRDRHDRNDNDNNVVETEFDIQVPASAELDVEVFRERRDDRRRHGRTAAQDVLRRSRRHRRARRRRCEHVQRRARNRSHGRRKHTGSFRRDLQRTHSHAARRRRQGIGAVYDVQRQLRQRHAAHDAVVATAGTTAACGRPAGRLGRQHCGSTRSAGT